LEISENLEKLKAYEILVNLKKPRKNPSPEYGPRKISAVSLFRKKVEKPLKHFRLAQNKE
jgi:hypothetical protein